MTLIVLLMLSFLFNENSDLYLFTKPKDMPTAAASGMTPEETEIFRRLSDKQAKLAAMQKTEKDENKDEPTESLEETYAYNMTKLLNRNM
jgi:hypothetical protein